MKNLFLLFSAVFFVAVSTAQTKVGGITMPNTETYKNHKLVLNGSGVREKMWIDLYAAGLYLNQKNGDAASILNSDEPMAIKLHIVSKLISSDKMVDAVTEGFENSTKGNTAPIQKEINQILGYFKEDIKKNDVFDLVYLPSEGGVVAYKNGEEKGVIKGMEFKKGLFGIWLSNRPADDGLRGDLLGK
ncbi:chalcone isomerase [Salinimicrobium marinum]|uniref:Chalcone isomerase n=1 Tax=Salinimicrobium marinum TaxID=680283 RepID=A0A918SD88_9FLAO|nr:chalcone isomerase family protein [Salinimicrobium marinum]GHA35100.1 chalcone isomerase [Salinimicrobium marinum]